MLPPRCWMSSPKPSVVLQPPSVVSDRSISAGNTMQITRSQVVRGNEFNGRFRRVVGGIIMDLSSWCLACEASPCRDLCRGGNRCVLRRRVSLVSPRRTGVGMRARAGTESERETFVGPFRWRARGGEVPPSPRARGLRVNYLRDAAASTRPHASRVAARTWFQVRVDLPLNACQPRPRSPSACSNVVCSGRRVL